MHWKSLSNITNLQSEGLEGLEMETLILKMQDKSSYFLSVDMRLLENNLQGLGGIRSF